jgi:hypothetical protein
VPLRGQVGWHERERLELVWQGTIDDVSFAPA